MAYATGNDLISRYDADLVGDLATDDREELQRSAIPGHPNVLAALDDASGELDASMLAGGRYRPAQLAQLASNPQLSTHSHLVRITCSLAMSLLCERRPDRVNMELAESYRKTAKAHLESLRRGENVFGIQDVVESGVIEIATVSTLDIEDLNLIPQRMPRYFPGTEQRQPR